MIFSVMNIRAVVVRVLLTFIGMNAAVINSRYSAILASTEKQLITIWDRMGVIMLLTKDEKGHWHLSVSTGTGNSPFFEIKVGSTNNVFNRRTLNALEVWYHSNLRTYKVTFDNAATNAVKQLDIRGYITDIGFMDRLFNRSKEVDIKLPTPLNEMISIHLDIKRSIFNKLMVSVSVSSPAITSDGKCGSALETLFPIHFGNLRQFNANIEQEPVNAYVQQAIMDHIEHNLK
ncbi:hypothetical protein N1M2_5 [Klebsiella phage N1M2]|uniref:Uncharacterized protein n=1 Tax=Klebsiella phage N1M2 TaxID=2664939 RepID=A0A6B7ZED6_9CAUD|nr:hypothetical protein PQB72_gp005 [Klebsiella phage N1M2]QGH71868.1 hypothetical protein N1M2_5 [Klebsiella phage N1M2]